MPIAPIYIVSALLFIGAASLPYGYYIFLRIVACAFFVWAAVVTYEQNLQYLPWIFGLLALLFNPIIKIHLPKELWAVVDLASSIFVLAVKKKLLISEREGT